MSALATINNQEIELISRFISLLETECETLKRGEAEALAELGASKEALIGQINALETARSKTLEIAGGESVRIAMDRWLKAHPEEQAAASSWDNLLDLTRHAKQLHELNSGLLNIYLQQTNEMLAILTQQSQKNIFYGSDGQAKQGTGSSIVDLA